MHHLERFRSPVAVTGDGGFLVASLESETAARLETRFVVLVFSDRTYGLISCRFLYLQP
jgi:thiamine pyrophosphate-dependent acetolactate synthase large subunit-like protein